MNPKEDLFWKDKTQITRYIYIKAPFYWDSIGLNIILINGRFWSTKSKLSRCFVEILQNTHVLYFPGDFYSILLIDLKYQAKEVVF